MVGRYNKGEKSAPGKDGTKQVWKVSADGSDLEQVTEVAGRIDSYQITSDGKFFYYNFHKDHMIEGMEGVEKRISIRLKIWAWYS